MKFETFRKEIRINKNIKNMSEIKEILDRLKEVKIKSDPTPFNMLHIAYQDVHGKEVLHSKLLAWLLDPNKNHCFGDVPLKTFLTQIGVSYKTIFDVSVEPEKRVPDGRIDIFISWTDEDFEKIKKRHAIIIENKLNDAEDREHQLDKYYDGTEKEYKIEKIVYIPFDKSQKPFEITDAKPEVKQICINFDAKDLVQWINSIKFSINEDASMLKQYKEFFECLLKINDIYMKAEEIMEQLNINDILKFEEIRQVMNNDELWCKALFKKQCPIVFEYFQNLQKITPTFKITFERLPKKGLQENVVELLFDPEPYIFWIELYVRKSGVFVYLCTYDGTLEEVISFADRQFTFNVKENGYFYYQDSKKCDYSFSEQGKLKDYLNILLKELSKYSPK